MKSKETKPAVGNVDIKDYILDTNPSEQVKVSKPLSPYRVLLQTSSDFIIIRKKARSERELVVLISENLFYFREKGIVEEITRDKLQAFLKDLRGESIPLEQVLWLPRLSKNTAEELFSVITNPSLMPAPLSLGRASKRLCGRCLRRSYCM